MANPAAAIRVNRAVDRQKRISLGEAETTTNRKELISGPIPEKVLPGRYQTKED